MNYLQIMGCAMGTNCTPPYANMLHNLKHIPTSNISQYYTYDISMIYLWHGQELSKNCLYFVEYLNYNYKTIKFEHNILDSNISLIYKDRNNTLQTTLYRNPTDQQSHLHAHLDHTRSLKKSILYIQAKRVKTIRSTLTEYKIHCAMLKQNFIERGYEENILKDQIDKVDNIDREDLSRKK